MQVVNAAKKAVDGGPIAGEALPSTSEAVKLHWMTMYGVRPAAMHELFELEAMVAKRMELLAWIDAQLNSQKTQNLGEVLKMISDRLPQESTAKRSGSASRGLGSDDPTDAPEGRSASAPRWNDTKEVLHMSNEEDLISHLLCRFAFCMSEKWRKWFIRVEEILMRAKYVALQQRTGNTTLIASLLQLNGLPCEPLQPSTAPPKLNRYVESLRSRTTFGATSATQTTLADFVSVPLGLATRLVKDRHALCHKGRAIIQNSQAHEVFLTVYKSHLARGLQDAYMLRSKTEGLNDEDAMSTMMLMLDAFLTRFVADPQDQLREMSGGVVRPSDVPLLAQTHFPLCMRRVDATLRTKGHLKHHGRLMYGLFLKAIGLSMEDSLLLFSNLMTVQGGNSLEAFAKSGYGYGVRHNYGKEGKKTSYSSMSCGSIVNLPPMVDAQYDCHGCPFKFRDEGALRQTLSNEQPHPYGGELPKIRPMPSAIEEMVQDAKDQHYTKACYKYFMATHPDAQRDSLFRSPFEYHVFSLQSKQNHAQMMEKQQGRQLQREGVEEGTTPNRSEPPKRTSVSLREGSTRPRTE